MGILMWILVGLVAGWLTGKIMKGSGYGFFVDILLGIAGALVGGFIADRIGLDAHGGFHLQHTDRRGRRGHPGGHPPAAQARVTAARPSFPHRFSGKDRVHGDLTQILQLTMVGAAGEALAGSAAAAGSRTSTAKRGKAKLPAASSITFNWQTYGPGLSPLKGTSSSTETASRPSTLIDLACTMGVS